MSDQATATPGAQHLPAVANYLAAQHPMWGLMRSLWVTIRNGDDESLGSFNALAVIGQVLEAAAELGLLVNDEAGTAECERHQRQRFALTEEVVRLSGIVDDQVAELTQLRAQLASAASMCARPSGTCMDKDGLL